MTKPKTHIAIAIEKVYGFVPNADDARKEPRFQFAVDIVTAQGHDAHDAYLRGHSDGKLVVREDEVVPLLARMKKVRQYLHPGKMPLKDDEGRKVNAAGRDWDGTERGLWIGTTDTGCRWARRANNYEELTGAIATEAP